MSNTNSRLSLSTGKNRSRRTLSSPSSPASMDGITPGQRERSPSPNPLLPPSSQELRGISAVSKTVVEDELASIERQVVSLAILREKEGKLRAMVDGKREIPRELTTQRSLPSLGPQYRFSPYMRHRAEELNKEQDREYVVLCLADLTGKVIPDAEQDLEDLFKQCRKRIARKVECKEVAAAEVLFNTKSKELLDQGEQLLARRRPQPQKKRRREESRRPSKKPRHDRPNKPVDRHARKQ